MTDDRPAAAMSSRPVSALALVHPSLAFEAHSDDVPTIGVEEELLLVDHDGLLAPVAEDVWRALEGDRRLALEFRTAQIETATPVCVTALDVERELVSARAALADAAQELARPLASPVFPSAGEAAPITEDERYRAIAGDAPWAGRELQTCGMHVHVGLRGAGRALAVANAARSHLPLLAALAASSPFHQGADAGVASVRARLNGTLPRSGVPPAFPSWDAFEVYLRWGARGGVIPDASCHWFDLRLNIACGTIEMRVFDVQTDASDAAALAALTQALVVWLAARHDEGEALPVHPGHRIRESLRLAHRDGTTGCLVDLDSGALVPVTEMVEALLEELAPVARSLGSARLLARIPGLAAVGGAERQRLVAASVGLRGLVRWLADQTVAAPSRRPSAA